MVLIGDGFAEGLGDWVVMGGMAGATRQLQMQAGTDDKVCEGCRDYVLLFALLEVAGRLRVCVRYYCFGWECSVHGT